MKSRIESCACASVERKLLQGCLQIMLTQGLAMPRAVAFDVSSLMTLRDTFTSPYTLVVKDICHPALLLVTPLSGQITGQAGPGC